MSKQGVIVSGGHIDKEFVYGMLKDLNADCIIAADRGLLFLHDVGIMPTHIVGDFDSVPEEILSQYRAQNDISIHTYNPVKDATDTEIALRLALQQGVDGIYIFGGTGTRIDHVMANIQILKIAKDAGVEAYLVDAHNKISLLAKNTRLQKTDAFGEYFSLFTLGGSVSGLTIRGAKYPLENHTLQPYDSLSVSNKIVENEVYITFSSGDVILIESRD